MDSLELKKAQVSRQISRIDSLQARFTKQEVALGSIASSVSSIALSASSLSQSVRGSAKEAKRISEALEFVNQTIVLRNAIENMQISMEKSEWDQAAVYVDQARKVPKNIRSSPFTERMVPSSKYPDYPEDVINNSCDKLSSLFAEKFQEAAQSMNMEQISRFFKLFPLIDRPHIGLELYAKFIASIISSQGRSIRNNVSEVSPYTSTKLYGNAFGSFLDSITSLLLQHKAFVEKHYGLEAFPQTFPAIQREADTHGVIILDSFEEGRKLSFVLQEISNYAFPYLASAFTSTPMSADDIEKDPSERFDSKSIDVLMAEMELMLSNWTRYTNTLASLSAAAHSNAASKIALPDVIKASSIIRHINSNVEKPYESMATFFFRRSVEKALELDEYPDEATVPSADSPLISSVIDDSMYVFKHTLLRVLSTGNARLSKSLLSNMRRILEADLIGILQRRLHDLNASVGKYGPDQTSSSLPSVPQISLGSRTVSSSKHNIGLSLQKAAATAVAAVGRSNSPDISTPITAFSSYDRNFLILLNGLDVSVKYLLESVHNQSVYNIVADLYTTENDADIVNDALEGITPSYSSRVKTICADALSTVFSQLIRPRIRPIINNTFKESDYRPSAHTTSPNHANEDSHVKEYFAHQWNALVAPYQKILTTDLFSELEKLIAASVAKVLEQKLWSLSSTKVDDIGAIRVERDVASIIAHICPPSKFYLRSYFGRVAQIIMTIGLEPGEEIDFIESKAGDIDAGNNLQRDELLKALAIRIRPEDERAEN
ncbi:hypothetical protein CANCADRAFT_45539 [Tortispora caseinolytica NRRL Y-17796]|uniref:Conserved oligomeric Golgi complex subunit 4 n=1 Tax=Tortispora caseinolytica NRRL Y-17796 TaxID=767744 RepID=A0A1E4TBD5_9ASCO|nr:hypothetical protein CANCADRAFT_45539 [Tortispora caseinolytica NRRL Y-17796]